MKLFTKITNISLLVLALIALLIDGLFIYYKYFDTDITIGVNYINDQLGIDVVKAEDLTNEEIDEYEERYFMVANYYDNNNNNGLELQELRFDYFTDYTLKSDKYRSTGMQYLGDFETYIRNVNSADEADRTVVEDFYYYDTTNGISWSGYNGGHGSVATTLNRDEVFIIKIDNRAFAIKLTGSYPIYGPLLGFLWTVQTGTMYYDYGDVFASAFNAIKSNDAGYGDYYITLDLSDFFSIKEYDIESGEYKADDVTDIIKNYAVLKFHYEDNGAVASTQSLFGSIECNPSYDLNEDYDTTYWQERVVYTLTEEDLSYRYSSVYGGYFASCKAETATLLNSIPRSKVIVDIDLSSSFLIDNEINILGLDYSGFKNVKLDTLKITGEDQTFYLLNESLKNTDLNYLKHSSGISLNLNEDVITTEYTEVIL